MHNHHSLKEQVAELDASAKKELVLATMQQLPEVEQREATVTAYKQLSAEEKPQFQRQVFGPPTQHMADRIWFIVVIGFVLVLIGVAGLLAFGVTFLKKSATEVQVEVTVITTVVGFLAGLLSPSPIQANRSI